MEWKTAFTGMYDANYAGNGFFRQKYFHAYYRCVASHVTAVEGEKVLDFGCQRGDFKKFLRYKAKYLGHDIDDRYGMKQDLNKIKVHSIVANHVLEHLTLQEMNEFVELVKRSGARELVVALPLENFLSTVLALLDGIYFSNKIEHSLTWQQVCNRLKQDFTNTRIETVWGMTIVTKWVV